MPGIEKGAESKKGPNCGALEIKTQAFNLQRLSRRHRRHDHQGEAAKSRDGDCETKEEVRSSRLFASSTTD
jgi:hypothetical protein